jgi:hypothetical protein
MKNDAILHMAIPSLSLHQLLVSCTISQAEACALHAVHCLQKAGNQLGCQAMCAFTSKCRIALYNLQKGVPTS